MGMSQQRGFFTETDGTDHARPRREDGQHRRRDRHGLRRHGVAHPHRRAEAQRLVQRRAVSRDALRRERSRVRRRRARRGQRPADAARRDAAGHAWISGFPLRHASRAAPRDVRRRGHGDDPPFRIRHDAPASRTWPATRYASSFRSRRSASSGDASRHRSCSLAALAAARVARAARGVPHRSPRARAPSSRSSISASCARTAASRTCPGASCSIAAARAGTIELDIPVASVATGWDSRDRFIRGERCSTPSQFPRMQLPLHALRVRGRAPRARRRRPHAARRDAAGVARRAADRVRSARRQPR